MAEPPSGRYQTVSVELGNTAAVALVVQETARKSGKPAAVVGVLKVLQPAVPQSWFRRS